MAHLIQLLHTLWVIQYINLGPIFDVGSCHRMLILPPNEVWASSFWLPFRVYRSWLQFIIFEL